MEKIRKIAPIILILLYSLIVAGIVYIIIDYSINPTEFPFQLWLVPIGGSFVLSGVISWILTYRGSIRQSDTPSVAMAWGALAAILSSLLSIILLFPIIGFMIMSPITALAGFVIAFLAGPLFMPMYVLNIRKRRQHVETSQHKGDRLSVISLILAISAGICIIITRFIPGLSKISSYLPDGFIYLLLIMSLAAFGLGRTSITRLRRHGSAGGTNVASTGMWLAVLEIIYLSSIILININLQEKITVVHIPDGKVAYKFKTNTSIVDFSPDGKYLSTLPKSADFMETQTIRLWNSNNGKLAVKLRSDVHYFQKLVFSSDSKLLAAGGDGISLWKIPESRPIMQIGIAYLDQQIIGLTSKNRLWSLAEYNDNASYIKLWNTASRKVIKQLKLKFGNLDGQAAYQPQFTLSNDGTMIAGVRATFSDFDVPDHAYIWDASNGKAICKIPRKEETSYVQIAFSPDSRLFAVTDKDTRVWQIPEAKLLYELGKAEDWQNEDVESIDFSENGRYLAEADMNQVRIWDMKDGKLVFKRNEKNDSIHDVSLSPDGQYLAVLSGRM